MLRRARRSAAVLTHTSLPQSAGELCKTNVTTYPCRLPKSNPEAISLYSASIVRCFTLMYLSLVWVTGKRRNKAISKKARHAVLAQGHCHWRQFFPTSLPCLVFPETTVQECGLQDTRRKEPTATTPFIQRVLTFSHLGFSANI